MITFGNPGIAPKLAVMLAVVLSASAGTAIVGTSPAFAASPTIAVDQSSGLVDAQATVVVGSGFTAGDRVGVVQCNRPADPAQISCNDADGAVVTVGARGEFQTQLTVRREFNGTNPLTGKPAGHVDCGVARGCAVTAGSIAYPGIFANPVPISFGG
ncbi:enediyne antibiotic chromoprotein [Kutzneria sp. CA-103260]|uniref:enediyne antibiotic chromoprotein n=1 Tax=Kutzneria sp. CA-103260 TaxID=2802641 RepID=UPI001BAB657D|nr:enediyne antibiotic chromoprotein [Kutzneria sp. CA-103260]